LVASQCDCCGSFFSSSRGSGARLSRMAMLPAATLMRQLEPYKRVLGVLLRGSCVSLAVSNPYLSLAEPAGAIMLRAGGKVPEHALQKLLAIHAPELAGVVWGHDAMTQQQVEHSPQAAATLAQVQDVLRRVAKLELPACWHADWDPLSPASCRILPAGGASAATPAQVQSDQSSQVPGLTAPVRGPTAKVGAASGKTASGEPPCSMAQLFLQDYLDTLGPQNTFG